MSADFIAMTAFVIVAVGVGLLLLLLNLWLPRLLGLIKHKRGKDEPYESGMAPMGSARDRFNVKFYLVALLFIIFDIETVFLVPWAIAYRQLIAIPTLAWVALVGGLTFLVFLALGLAYEWARGGMDWS